MDNAVIRVSDLGKQYRIGHVQRRHDTLRDALMDGVRQAGRSLRGRAGADQSDTVWALRHASFDVPRGQVVGIVGRNGAGKTTLLKILSRITEPSEGRAEIHGRVGSLLEVGTGFHPELTGRENIYLNGAILGMKRAEIERKFDEIVAFAEIERFLDTPVKRYSSGMYVRLAFAVAAHLEPEILLVDEVLAVGDASFQKKCLGKMDDVAREGRTVLFVSHNMAAVAQLCSQAILLKEGRVAETGAAPRIIEHYLSAGNVQVAERAWAYPGNAPGDERVRLLGCRVLQQGQVAGVVDINEPCRVAVDFQLLQDVRNLVSGVSLYTAEGLCLFDSCDWRPNALRAGRYHKHVDLPGPLLAEGVVNVLLELIFYEPDIRSVVLRDAMTFEAVDSNHPLSVRGLYKGTWPGALRLHLPWSDAEPASGQP